jgi:type II secretory pathway pseudopilin PulG
MIQKEAGFGLITVAVVVAIAAMIAAGAGMTTIQIVRGTERNEEHAETVQQAHNLGRWFYRDAMTAENITAGDDTATGEDELLSMYWKDWESGEYCNIRYIWLDDVDSLQKIMRNQVMYDKDGAVAENTTSLVAFGIGSANLSQQDNTWTLNVTACSGEKSSAQDYKITQRSN